MVPSAAVCCRTSTRKAVLAAVILFLSGCAYTMQPARPNSLTAVLDALGTNNPPLTSMKALASVSLRYNDRGAEFPEGIIIDGTNMRLETLNLFYQPMLIIVSHGDVAVLDVRTGACSISSPALLERYTGLRAGPAEFENLITGRLFGKAGRMNRDNGKLSVSGTFNQAQWTADLDASLRVQSIIVRQPGSDPLQCVYSSYKTFDRVILPRHVTCSSGKRRLSIHYRTVRINRPVAHSLTDIQKLCGTGTP